MIGEKLKKRRTKLKLTQDEVAKKLHVSRQAISNWELGKNYPDLEMIIKISDYYQLSLDTLLKGDDKIVKEINKEAGLKIAKRISYGLLLLGAIVSLIVDLAVNGKLSWSLIVILSIGLGGIPSIVITTARKYRLFKGGAVLSLLIPIYLWLLESVLLKSGYVQEKWFMKIALPVSLLWLSILWLVSIIQWRVKWQWSYSLALLCLIAIPGNYVTNMLVNSEAALWSTIVTAITNGIGAILFTMLGLAINRYQFFKK